MPEAAAQRQLELCLALGKRAGCRFIWLSATVDPAFYRRYLDSAAVLETTVVIKNRFRELWEDEESQILDDTNRVVELGTQVEL